MIKNQFLSSRPLHFLANKIIRLRGHEGLRERIGSGKERAIKKPASPVEEGTGWRAHPEED